MDVDKHISKKKKKKKKKRKIVVTLQRVNMSSSLHTVIRSLTHEQ